MAGPGTGCRHHTRTYHVHSTHQLWNAILHARDDRLEGGNMQCRLRLVLQALGMLVQQPLYHQQTVSNERVVHVGDAAKLCPVVAGLLRGG